MSDSSQADAAAAPAETRPNTFFCIDGHTCGNPVRLVAAGGPALRGATMSEKRQDFLARYEWIRTGLMFEPRGHDQISGSFLYPPSRSDCDVAVLFIATRKEGNTSELQSQMPPSNAHLCMK